MRRGLTPPRWAAHQPLGRDQMPSGHQRIPKMTQTQTHPPRTPSKVPPETPGLHPTPSATAPSGEGMGGGHPDCSGGPGRSQGHLPWLLSLSILGLPGLDEDLPNSVPDRMGAQDRMAPPQTSPGASLGELQLLSATGTPEMPLWRQGLSC